MVKSEGLFLMAAAFAALSLMPSVALAAGSDVTIVLDVQPDQVDACQASKSQVGKVIKQNVTETLTEIDPANGQVIPRLATEWSQTDPKTWRLKLRENVKFHDGTPFNGEALKVAFARLLNDKLDCEIRVKYFGGLEIDVGVLGEHEVEIKTNRPIPILPTLLSTVTVPAPSTPHDEYSRQPIGTGPYTFANWQAGKNIVLKRFDEYWGEKPTVASATYIWRQESTVRAAMVASGEADIAFNIAVQDATNPKTDFSYLNAETTRLRIDVPIIPLDDIRVRQALNYAIDRDALKGTIFSDDVVPATQLVVPGTNGHNPDLTPYPYDPEKAIELLKQARADGVAVDKEILLIGRHNFFPNSEEAVQALQAMYAAVGLKVRLQMTESSEWFDSLFKPFAENRGPNLFLDQHDNTSGDASLTIYAKYHSKGGQTVLDDSELDDLIDRANVATGEERTKLFQQAFGRIHEDLVGDVALFHMVGFTRVNERLEFKPTLATNGELQLAQIKIR